MTTGRINQVTILKATARAAPDQGRAPAELYTERGAEAPSGAVSRSEATTGTTPLSICPH
jgi:hypothetical protein